MTKQIRLLINLIGGCTFLYLWLTLPILSSLSERVWTFMSKIDDGKNPGLASDLEIVFIFLTGTILAIFVQYCCALFLKCIRVNKS